jgi:hypothetical protein
METDTNSKFCFLDIDICRILDGSLGHTQLSRLLAPRSATPDTCTEGNNNDRLSGPCTVLSLITKLKHSFVRLQVLTEASMKMTVFWVVAPCCLVEVYQRFRGACCFHHQSDEPG